MTSSAVLQRLGLLAVLPASGGRPVWREKKAERKAFGPIRDFRVLVRERSEERRALVRIAPLGPECCTGEGVLRSSAYHRIGNLGQWTEPLPRATARIVIHFLGNRQSQRLRGDADSACVVGKLAP